MRFKWLSDYWLGIFMALSLIVLSLWLAVHGKLALYVHPRYIWFTVILCALGLLGIIADIASRKRLPQLTERVRLVSIIAGGVCLMFCMAVFILKPVGLSSSTAGQRGINSAALTISTDTSLADLRSTQVDYAKFTLKEWAALLSQTTDSTLFAGKTAFLSGFVSPTPDNDPNVFYVSRFVMTCCAVDARPIGVPVHKPNWGAEYKPDQWLEVRGTFKPGPHNSSTPTILEPRTITPIDQPDEPYAY